MGLSFLDCKLRPRARAALPSERSVGRLKDLECGNIRKTLKGCPKVGNSYTFNKCLPGLRYGDAWDGHYDRVGKKSFFYVRANEVSSRSLPVQVGG